MSDTYELDKPGKPYASPCPSCGQLMSPGDVVCTRCGFNLGTGKAEQTTVAAAPAPTPTTGAWQAPPSHPVASPQHSQYQQPPTNAASAQTGVAMTQTGAASGVSIGGQQPASGTPDAAAMPHPGAAPATSTAQTVAMSKSAIAAGGVIDDKGRGPGFAMGPLGAVGEGAMSPEGGMGLKTLGIIGLAVLAVATVMSIASTKSGVAMSLGNGILTVYLGLLHAGTGIVAVLAAAFILKRPTGRLDLAAGRMLIAFAAFKLCISVSLTDSTHATLVALSSIVMLAIGAGAYWGLVWLLFGRKTRETNHIAAAHAILYIVVHLGAMLQVGLQSTGGPGDAIQAQAAQTTTGGAAK